MSYMPFSRRPFIYRFYNMAIDVAPPADLLAIPCTNFPTRFLLTAFGLFAPSLVPTPTAPNIQLRNAAAGGGSILTASVTPFNMATTQGLLENSIGAFHTLVPFLTPADTIYVRALSGTAAPAGCTINGFLELTDIT